MRPWAIAALVNAADLFGKTPASQARSRGHFQIEKLLTKALPLYIAASQGNIEIMKPLLDAVSTLLADGKRKEAREVLYSACEVKEEVGTLMVITPLRIAAINRHDKAVNLLLEKIRKLFIT
ncbi:ankyrin repeat domain-containing protein [Endozoicomonas acroporae]|uniref:ankyrin repeat domain-containing protein n=1 Tax=Endozoicomonas acroporae TaxID=1701104 RepID=UPI000C785A23|nr:ankyrin repeat domain-containing protein [Endozoicomonas acroporae]